MKKLVSLIFGLAILFSTHVGWAQSCPANVTAVSPSAQSCWVPPSSGTTISDLIDSNPLTIQSNSTYGLQAGNTLGCGTGSSAQPNQISSGCNLISTQSYSPSSMTVVMKFSGTGGPLAQFANTSSVNATYQYFELYLDTFGRLTWGAMNYGSLQTLQTGTKDRPKVYADGNPHIVVASIGSNGMRLYVDGSLVANDNGFTLADYATGLWLFGNANLTGTNPSGASWPYASSQGWFNGTLYYWAWWNSQLTDTQAETLSNPGTNPPGPITNNYATITGQMGSLALTQGYAFANQAITFQTQAGQLPACGATIPVAATQQIYYTDPQGNLPSTLQLQQGAHVNMIWAGTTTPLIIPCMSTVPIAELIPAQTPLPDAVSSIILAGPLYQGTVVSNPAVGTIGPATLTAPGTVPNTCAGGTTTINRNLGPQQSCTLSANTTVTFSNLLDGAPPLILDVIENGTGGFNPTFSAPAGFTFAIACPALSTTAANSHAFYNLVVEGTNLYCSLGSTSSGSGTFPLTATANFNNWSGTNINTLNLSPLTPPSGLSISSTCSGTCATTYTYEVTCLDDNLSETLPTSAASAINAASLSGSNFNTLNWTNEAACHNGYNVYGRVNGSLGLLATVGAGVTTYQDTGAASPGASPPTTNTTGLLNGNINGNLQILTTLGDTLYENAMPANARLAGNIGQLANPTFGNSNVTNLGGTGSTTYTYFVVCNDSHGGKTLPSSSGVTTTGNATLSAGRSFSDGVENATTTLTSATAAFVSGDVGRSVTGSGILSGTTIASFTNSTTVVLSAAATQSVSGVSITLGPNANQIALPSELGCVSWDILKTDTAHSLALAQTGATYNDLGTSTSAYVAPAANTTVQTGFLESIGSAGRTFSDAVENSTTTLTSATASFVSGDVGRSVTGSGIPASTIIASVTNSTTVVMNHAATTSASGVTISLGPNPQAPSWAQLAVSDVPGFDGITVTGVPTAGQVPVATSATAATWQSSPTQMVPHGMQLFALSGTFTVPSGVYSVDFKAWGPGGGGGGFGAGSTNGSNGNASTTVAGAGVGGSTLTASAGNGGNGANSGLGTCPASAGVGSNGIFNLPGGLGKAGGFSLGGIAPFMGSPDASGGSLLGYGSAGDGGTAATPAFASGGCGGSAGGFAENVISTTPAATFTVTVGTGGSQGTGGTSNGGNGVNGAVLATW